MNSQISNRDISPEEQRRRDVFVSIQLETVEHIVLYIVEIIENEDWSKFGFDSFIGYIDTAFDKGGIGWTYHNLRLLMEMAHRQEWDERVIKDQEFLIRLTKARAYVNEWLARYPQHLDEVLTLQTRPNIKTTLDSKRVRKRKPKQVVVNNVYDIQDLSALLKSMLSAADIESLVINLKQK